MILVIILVIFGAGKLPEIGKGLGKGIRNFKESSSEKPDEIPSDSDESKKKVEGPED